MVCRSLVIGPSGLGVPCIDGLRLGWICRRWNYFVDEIQRHDRCGTIDFDWGSNAE